MKRILCAVAAALVLLGSVAAYNGDVIVYVTNTGSKYHRAGCSYLKSSNEITLEAAVNQGYSPCSRCNPPRLSGEKPNAESNGPGRTDRMWEGFASNDASSGTSRTSRWLEEYNASHPDEAKAAGNAGSELDMALREKERAIEAKEWAEKKADTAQSLYDSLREDYNTLQDDYKEIKRTVFYGGLIVVFVGLPLYYIWFYYWKKRETERITASVRASLEAATLNTERLESSPKKAMPEPKPKPKQEPDPPVKPPYGPEEPENPFLRETYRQLYEGKSISKIVGVPSYIRFDENGYPHQKGPRAKDPFTVYITQSGKSYHTYGCPSGKSGRAVHICYAKQRGLGPCDRCNPMRNLPDWLLEYQRIVRICEIFRIDVEP